MTKPYFILINCLFIIAAAYLGVSAFYQISTAQIEHLEPLEPSNGRELSIPDTIQRPLSHYRAIEKRNLFHVKSDTEKSIEPVNLESLEQTDLKLKLWGTVTGDSSGAYAVIEDTKARSQNLYRKNDTVQNAVIKMILREKVVLRVGGKDEILDMEKAKTGRVSKKSTVARRAATSSQIISLKRSQIDDALKNVNQLMQQVKIMPHFDKGQPDGFSLTGIKPNSIVRKMGLRNGDIIIGVNGQKIETMDDALGFYQQLSSASDLSISVRPEMVFLPNLIVMLKK